MYTVEYKQSVIKSFKKLDRHTALLIIAWIEKYLCNTKNPRAHGKSLSANLAGSWRYRIGDYRILVNIDDQTKTVLILDIDHRSRIYNKKLR